MKIKILFFIESLSGGGAEKVLVTLLQHLDVSKFEVTLLTVHNIGIYVKEIDRNKINYRSLCGNGSSLWNKIKYKLIYQWLPAWLVYFLFIPKGYDTTVAFVEGFCAKILANAKGRKIVWVHINLQTFPWTQEQRIFSSLEEEKQCYQLYDEVICVSRSVETAMRCHYGLNQTCTLYNPLDAGQIQKKGNEPSPIAIDSEAFNMLSIGRLNHQKGYDLLIPIIQKLKGSGRKIHLYLAGDGPQRKSLEALIEKYHLQNDVTLTGFLPNPYALLSKMDLFVCSSRAEGFSLVIAEALILGIPVVSTYCSGPNELLQEGKYGVLCHDYDSLEQTLKHCTEDIIFMRELKEKALNGQKQFDLQQTIGQIEDLL